MSKRDAFFDELFDDDGIRIVADDDTNVENGRRLLGATLVGQMDTSIESALEVVDGNNRYTDGSPLHAERQQLCDSFTSMSESQREAVRALLRDTASLMLFSICSNLDQFPGYDVAVHLERGRR